MPWDASACQLVSCHEDPEVRPSGRDDKMAVIRQLDPGAVGDRWCETYAIVGGAVGSGVGSAIGAVGGAGSVCAAHGD